MMCCEIREWLEAASDFHSQFPNRGPDVTIRPLHNFHEGGDADKHISKIDCNRNSSGDYAGDGVVNYENGDYFEGSFLGRGTDRCGVLTRHSDHGALTFGTWIDGGLEGDANEETAAGGGGGWQLSQFKSGVRHGPSRTFGPAKGRKDNLRTVAFYDSGDIVGRVWKGLIGGAFLFGPVDDDGEIDGEDCLFIYPDLATAICGAFHRGELISGRTHDLEPMSGGFENGIPVPKVARRGYGPPVYRGVSTAHSLFSSRPLQSDLWESFRVVVQPSGLGEDAGEGLYSRIGIASGQMIALYNGVRKRVGRWDDDTTKFDYRIRLNGQFDLDVPGDSTSLERYCATLGHKANHSFLPNSKYGRMEHARLLAESSFIAFKFLNAINRLGSG